MSVKPCIKTILVIAIITFQFTFACIHLHGIETKPPEMIIQNGHSWGITAIAFSQDNKFLVSGGKDGTIIVWSVETGEIFYIIKRNYELISSIIVSPNDNLFVSASYDGTISIWRFFSDEPITTMKVDNCVTSLSFSPDGAILASSDSNGDVSLWSMKSYDLLSVIDSHDTWTMSVDFHPNGRTLVSAGGMPPEYSVRVLSVESCEPLNTIEFGDARVETAALNADGTKAIILLNERIMLFTMESAREIGGYQGTSRCLLNAILSPGEDYLLLGGCYENALELISLQSGQTTKTIEDYYDGFINATSFSHDGSMFASGGSDGRIKIWSYQSGALLQTLDPFDWQRIGHVLFMPGGEQLTAVLCKALNPKECAYSRLVSFALPNGKIENMADGPQSVQNGVDAISPNGSMLSYLEHGNFDRHFWSVSDASEIGFVDEDGYGIENLEYPAFAPDNETIAAFFCEDDFNSHGNPAPCIIKMYSITQKKFISSAIEGINAAGASALALSPDGKMIAVGYKSHIGLFSVHTGEMINTLKGFYGRIQAITYSIDGNILAIILDDGRVFVWDLPKHTLLSAFQASQQNSDSISISSDNRYVATTGDGIYIQLWELRKGLNILNIVPVDDSCWLFISPDGKFDFTEKACASQGIRWKMGSTVFPADKFFSEYYSPGLFNLVWRGIY